MKTTLKKVLSMALALVLLVGVLPFQASATGNVTVYVNETAAQIAPGTYTFSDLATFCNTVLKGSTLDAVNYYHITADSNHTNGHSGATAGGFTASDNLSVNIHPELCVHLTVTPCAHTNSTAATCETPGTCNDCGFEVEPKLGHNMQQTAARLEPTCGAAGSEAVMTCSNGCGKSTGGAVIPATGNHDFGDNASACLNCGAKNENYVAPAVVTVNFYVDGTFAETKTSATPATIQTLITNLCTVDDNAALIYDYAIANNANAALTTVVNAGQTANIYLKTKATTSYIVYYNVNVDASKDNRPIASFVSGATMGDALDKLSTMTITRPGLYPTWFKLAGWYWDRACTNPVRRDTMITEDTVVYAKWERKYNYEVTLKLYTNGNTNTVVKVVDAFAYIQDDGILSNSEVTAIAKEYIKSNNDAPITAYGPFKSGTEWDNYCKYPNRLSTQNQYIAEDDPATVLHVMVHNAKIYNSTSSTGKKADSTNPKTGDMIMVPAAVMGTTVSALAVMFYLKKKRTV